MFCQKHLTKSATSQCWYDVKTRKIYLAVFCDFIQLISELLLLCCVSLFYSVLSCFLRVPAVIVVLLFWRFSLRFLLYWIVLWLAVFSIVLGGWLGCHESLAGAIVFLHDRVVAASWYCTVFAANAHVENVFLYLFWWCLELFFNVLDYQLVSLDFRS